jgi:hypothetical protein
VSTAQGESSLLVTERPYDVIGEYPVGHGSEQGKAVTAIDDPLVRHHRFECDGDTVEDDVQLGLGPDARLIS